MSRTSRRCSPFPPEVRETADLLERRWQLSIIYAALTGALRFNEFAEAVAGISPRMLSERLRDLEAAGLVRAHGDPLQPADRRVPADRARAAARPAHRGDARPTRASRRLSPAHLERARRASGSRRRAAPPAHVRRVHLTLLGIANAQRRPTSPPSATSTAAIAMPRWKLCSEAASAALSDARAPGAGGRP